MKFKAGDEVVRLEGKYEKGDRGTVVEVGPEPTDWIGAVGQNSKFAGRTRVLWHTYGTPYRREMNKPKRTWVANKSLGPVLVEKPTPARCLLYVDEAGNYSGPFVGN